MKTVTVTRNGKTLNASYTPELEKDLKTFTGLDIETELRKLLERELEEDHDKTFSGLGLA